MGNYTSLSALDRSFLDIEDRTVHMHVGAVCILEPGPLHTTEGGIDIERIRDHVRSRLHRIPRYRQRLEWTPIERHPIWVDDESFSLNYHVRHTALPRPGDLRQLRRMSGRIFSQQLDRGKPLWELWIVEGLDSDRFAIITKTHHCMVDGIAGVDLFSVLLDPNPDTAIGVPHRWHPRRPPSTATLIRDSVVRRVVGPSRNACAAAVDAIRRPRETLREVADGLSALRDAAVTLASPTSRTQLNEEIGANRRFDWLTMPLDDIRAIKNRSGGTVNDVVLSIVAGAVARFFEYRGMNLNDEGSGFTFRLFCPIGLAGAAGGRRMGNRVSAMMIDAPIAVDSPLARLDAVRDLTESAKKSHQSEGVEIIEHFADWAAPSLIGVLDQLSAVTLAFNMVCTNVPGPQFPLYLCGARLAEGYPLVPLFRRQGIGIALLSYTGHLGWGVVADRELVPDLHDFVRCLQESFGELKDAVGLGRTSSVDQSASRTEPPSPVNEEAPAPGTRVH